MSNLDYLAARLHGRRSSMAEGEKLDTLIRMRSVPEFARTVFPERDFTDLSNFQRQLIEALGREIASFAPHLKKTQAPLIAWMPARFVTENLKVLLRASITKVDPEDAVEHLVALPKQDAALIHQLASAGSPSDFERLLPPGNPFKKNLRKAIADHGEDARPFFFEAALDQAYLRELMMRFRLLSGGDKEETGPVIRQEADIFHLMLVLRGRFHYGLPAEQLLKFHVRESAIPVTSFAEMLNDPDPWAVLNRVVLRAVDPMTFEGGPGEGSIPVEVIESLAWRRYVRLANMAFRRSHIGFGVVVGYVALKRVEIANLIAISEGIRTGMASEAIRAYMVPRKETEAARV